MTSASRDTGNRIILIAHNIRSLWNVGALFRTCDCFAVEKLILSGYSATPPRREISKTALGADSWVPWEKVTDPNEALDRLKSEGWRIVGLELSEDSCDIQSYAAQDKTALLIGNEVLGVSRELLSVCDDIVSIPMFGKKESLNVAVAAGIALHHFRVS